MQRRAGTGIMTTSRRRLRVCHWSLNHVGDLIWHVSNISFFLKKTFFNISESVETRDISLELLLPYHQIYSSLNKMLTVLLLLAFFLFFFLSNKCRGLKGLLTIFPPNIQCSSLCSVWLWSKINGVWYAGTTLRCGHGKNFFGWQTNHMISWS